MAGKVCLRCGMKRTTGVHTLKHPDYDHPYVLDGRGYGKLGANEGVKNWRKESGYDAKVKTAQGLPCAVVSPVCTGMAEHLHEPLSRGRAGGLRKAVELGGTVDCCDPCNGYIAENPVWAKERGWSFSNTIEGREAARQAKETRESAAVETAPPSSLPKRSRLR